MKLTRLTLATTTALGLSMAMAHAGDGNKSFIDQDGNNNATAITQSGDRNDAGRSGDDMLQNGAGNSLTIDQTGDDNQVGASAQSGFHIWTNRGVEQQGDNNSATVTQGGPYGVINELYQNSAAGAPGATNTLTITQEASSPNNDGSKRFANVISRVEQVHGGGAENKVTISQDRSTNGGPTNWGRNVIGDRRGFDGAPPAREGNIEWGVRQDGSGNTADLTQTGDRNAITQVHQIGDDNSASVNQDNTGSRGVKNDYNLVHNIKQDSTGYFIGNTAAIVQDGLRNGTPKFAAGSYSGMAGATPKVVRQFGGANNINYKAIGNGNGFGFDQNGFGNTVGAIIVTGDDNMLGVRQEDTNVLDVGGITGDRNDIGVLQTGYNYAQIALADSSDDNGVWVKQSGFNVDTTIEIDGDSNVARLDQDGYVNSADIDIIGNHNNNSTSTSWGGAAALKTGLGAGDVGLMKQDGSFNSLNVTVDGSDNLWATDQQGLGNKIVASVSGGSGNQFGVVQTSTGMGHTANVTQVGSGNNIGISQ